MEINNYMEKIEEELHDFNDWWNTDSE